MKIAEVSVKRPVFAIMMTAALIVLGAVSYESLGLDLMPKTDAAVVSVQANLPGASAEEIETQITKRIEEAVNTISGIDELRASSDQGNVARHHQLHARARHRVGDPGRARQAGADRQPVPARHPAAADHQDGSRRAADLRLRRLRPARAEGADRDRREARQAGARDGQGRRLGRLQRRAQARDPAAARRRSAQRLRPDGRGGAHRGAAAERRDSGRPVHRRAGRGRGPHDGPHPQRRRLQPHRHRLPRRRLGDHVRRHRPRPGQRAGSAERDAPVSGTPAIGVQVRKQSGTNTVEVVDRVQERLAPHPGPAAAGHPDQHRQRPVALHPPVVRGHQACT